MLSFVDHFNFFFKNLFEPNENNKIKNNKKLTKNNWNIVKWGIYDKEQENKEIIQKYITERQIRLEWTSQTLSKEIGQELSCRIF